MKSFWAQLVKCATLAKSLLVNLWATIWPNQSIRTRHQQDVLTFNLLAGVARPDIPSQPSHVVMLSRARLIFEEAFEVVEAMGFCIQISSADTPPRTITFKDVLFWNDRPTDSLPNIAKEFADLHVVTTGSEQAFGIDLEPIQAAVDKNNLGKFGSGGYRDINGKWIKPPGYPKPDVASLLRAQGWSSLP